MDFHILLYIRHLVLTQGVDVAKSEWALRWMLELSKGLKPGEAHMFIINEEIP